MIVTFRSFPIEGAAVLPSCFMRVVFARTAGLTCDFTTLKSQDCGSAVVTGGSLLCSVCVLKEFSAGVDESVTDSTSSAEDLAGIF